MLQKRISAVLAGVMAMLSQAPAFAAEGARGGPEFREIYDLIRAHLSGTSESDLNRAAVEGLAAALAPKVALVFPSSSTNGHGLSPVSKTNLFDGVVAYLRVEEVTEGLAPAIRQACDGLDVSNHVTGLVLDFRYAHGGDYAAAVAAADLFLKKGRPLLNWGQGVVLSTAKTNVIAFPAAVLVNHQTRGAAEALAAILREAGVGLILGSQTAGQALMFEEFPLKSGGRLRIATAPVQLGDGVLLAGGVKPDIAVEVSPADERAYFADAYKAAGSLAGAPVGVTNQPRRLRMNEAELVRERREGPNPDEGLAPGHKAEPEKALVQDPVLARALDLLKGLAVVRPSRP